MAAACGQPLQQALEPLHSVPVLRQHPAVDGVGQSADAVELQFKEPRRVVERLLADSGDDRGDAQHSRSMTQTRSRSQRLAQGESGFPVSPRIPDSSHRFVAGSVTLP